MNRKLILRSILLVSIACWLIGMIFFQQTAIKTDVYQWNIYFGLFFALMAVYYILRWIWRVKK